MMCLHFGCRSEAGDTWTEPYCERHANLRLRRPHLRIVEPRIYEAEEEDDDDLDIGGVTPMDVAGGFLIIIAIMVVGVLLV